MNTQDKNEAMQQTEESKQHAMNEAKENNKKAVDTNETIHTINPFTGTKTDITPDDLENMEKMNEAQTERD